MTDSLQIISDDEYSLSLQPEIIPMNNYIIKYYDYCINGSVGMNGLAGIAGIDNINGGAGNDILQGDFNADGFSDIIIKTWSSFSSIGFAGASYRLSFGMAASVLTSVFLWDIYEPYPQLYFQSIRDFGSLYTSMLCASHANNMIFKALCGKIVPLAIDGLRSFNMDTSFQSALIQFIKKENEINPKMFNLSIVSCSKGYNKLAAFMEDASKSSKLLCYKEHSKAPDKIIHINEFCLLNGTSDKEVIHTHIQPQHPLASMLTTFMNANQHKYHFSDGECLPNNHLVAAVALSNLPMQCANI
jgi:hypothetical protein